MEKSEHISHIYARTREMQAEIDFLRSLVCGLEDDNCKCEKCWSDMKYKELGGREFMLDWKMNEIKREVSKLWIKEKRNRLKTLIDIATNM